MKQFISGHYYKLSFYNEVCYYFQFNYIEDSTIFSYFEIEDNEYTDNKWLLESHYVEDDVYIYTEISIEEIIDLLPDSNINKINYLRKQRIKKLLFL